MASRPFRGDSDAYSTFRQAVQQILNNRNRGTTTQASSFHYRAPRVEIRNHPQSNYSTQAVPYVILHYPDGTKETKVFRTATEYHQWVASGWRRV